MASLVDTSVLGRLANIADPMHAVAMRAIVEMHRRGEILHITAQNLIEFRSVATRPAAINGLALSGAESDAKASAFEATFPLLEEGPDIYPAWKSLVTAIGVIGKQVHDARLISVCHAHRVSHLLTFNTGHFARFTGYGPGIVIVDPASI